MHDPDRPTGGPPTTCPRGHQLGPGLVLNGWAPCGCTSTRRGHSTVQCVECMEAGWTNVRYDLPHLGGGHPVTRR